MKDALGHGSDARGEASIREKIVQHLERTGRAPSYAKLGGYHVADPILNKMIREGVLKWVDSETPSGRRSQVLRLAGSPDRVIGRISRGSK